MIKTYSKSYLTFIIILLLLTIILSLINYFVPFDNTIPMICIPTIAMFSSSIMLGKACKQKAYFEGIKFSLLYLIILSIIKIITNSSFNYKVIIIYFLLIFSSIIGCMLGINLKKE